jgi:hypothetical protein
LETKQLSDKLERVHKAGSQSVSLFGALAGELRVAEKLPENPPCPPDRALLSYKVTVQPMNVPRTTTAIHLLADSRKLKADSPTGV